MLGLPQLLNERRHLLSQLAGGGGDPGADDLEFLLVVGVVHPVIKAASLKGVVDLPGTVGGADYDGRMGRLEGTLLRYGYLVVGKEF